MSLLTHAYLLDRYGLRISIDQLTDILNLKCGTIYNQISAQTFPIRTYTDGGKRFADYRDVATYLDECRQRAG